MTRAPLTGGTAPAPTPPRLPPPQVLPRALPQPRVRARGTKSGALMDVRNMGFAVWLLSCP